MSKQKTVVILSGGLDSAVLAASLQAEGFEVYALSVDYGQRHRTELDAAEAVARHLGVAHECVDVSDVRKLMGGSSQTDPAVPVPHGHYAEESMKATVVPNRNMILLALAGAWAVALKAESVAYGAHAGDHAVYPDCREEFVVPLAQALAEADWHKVAVRRPFLESSKADIVRLGEQLGAGELMALTYSCYEGRALHCGKCGTCTERKEAFKLAGVLDPTAYESEAQPAAPEAK